MDFVKKNLISVIAVALAIIGIPVMVYFSSAWNAEIREEFETSVASATRGLQNTRVEYQMPIIGAGGEPWSLNTEPSQLKNATLGERLERLVQRSASVRRELERLNSAGKSLLIQGDARYGDLFPAPASESARVALLTRLMDEYPEVHERMLEEARIKGPPSEELIRSRLEAARTREAASITASRVNQELSDEENALVRERLGEVRASYYRDHARGVTFYAQPSLFAGVPTLDPERGDEIIPLERAWEWQHRLWLHEDLIEALTNANLDEAGEGNVLSGPVKRVVSIAVDPREYAPGSGGSTGQDQQGGAAAGSLSAPIAPDYSKSHTGLNAWPDRPNPLYDLRYATITMLVDGDRIPEVVRAISETNLMTVIDLDFREYDGDADMRQGYDYGSGQTVALTLRVESAWLHSWMKPNMPESVRTQLGIPADPEPAATADAQ